MGRTWTGPRRSVSCHPNGLPGLAELLIGADWLTEAGTSEGWLRGRLTERIQPLGGLL
ncbi:hypothetical protein GCM10027168_21120 [Streptomyces capparidis]